MYTFSTGVFQSGLDVQPCYVFYILIKGKNSVFVFGYSSAFSALAFFALMKKLISRNSIFYCPRASISSDGSRAIAYMITYSFAPMLSDD